MDGWYCCSAIPLCPQQAKSSFHNKKENQASRVAFVARLLTTICLQVFLVSIPISIVAQTPGEGDRGRESTLSVSGTAVPNASPYAVSVSRLGVSSKAAKHLEWAQKRFIKLDLPGAIAEINQALDADPDCAQAFSMRAFVKLALKDFSGAIEDAHRAIALDPHDPASSLALATAYNDAREFPNAAEAAQQALSLSPTGWQGRLELAKSRYGQGQYSLALEALERVNKDFPDVHLVRANVLMHLGRTAEAAEQFRIFLIQAPKDPRDQEIQRIVANAGGQPCAPIAKP
jgi:tetratricopeptide (TPR) repeat protein